MWTRWCVRVCQSWSSVPYLPSCFQLKRFTRYMSAIGALETVALTQVYRDEPTLPVSDYPNFSAATIVRRMTGERLMLCRMRLMAHESSNCVGFQRGTPSNQGQTTEDDSSHDYRTLSDRKSTRLNSSHEWISYAVFCLKK